jgi:hypothetical protein
MTARVTGISLRSCLLLGALTLPLGRGGEACSSTAVPSQPSRVRSDQPDLKIRTGFELFVGAGVNESIGPSGPRFFGSVCLQFEVCEEFGNVDIGERLNLGVAEERHGPHWLSRRRHSGARSSFLRVIDGARSRGEAQFDSSPPNEFRDRWSSTSRGTTRPAWCRAAESLPGTGSSPLGYPGGGGRGREAWARPDSDASAPCGPHDGTGIGFSPDSPERRLSFQGALSRSEPMALPRVPISRSRTASRTSRRLS